MNYWITVFLLFLLPFLANAQPPDYYRSCDVYGQKATISFAKQKNQLILGVKVSISNLNTKCEKGAPLTVSMGKTNLKLFSLDKAQAFTNEQGKIILDIKYRITEKELKTLINNMGFFSSINIKFADREESYPVAFYYNTIKKTAKEFSDKISMQTVDVRR